MRWPIAPGRSRASRSRSGAAPRSRRPAWARSPAVARGSHAEPQLIAIRHEPADVAGPLLGFVGKGVTFDSGGISIKPAAKMSEMKFDMSGAAAVLEATGAIARLGLPARVVTVIGATENLPSGHAVKPGDILRAKTGTTIEVLNTDAEGRLVLADCLAHAIDLGAERLVDLATLTGAIVTTFGNTYAGLFGSDDEWCAEVEAAGRRTGELAWRLPLHAEYAELIKSRYADIANAVEARKAGSITAAEFLRRFTGEVPWRTSTSPAPRTRTASRTRPRAAPASACACCRPRAGATAAPRKCTELMRPAERGDRALLAEPPRGGCPGAGMARRTTAVGALGSKLRLERRAGQRPAWLSASAKRSALRQVVLAVDEHRTGPGRGWCNRRRGAPQFPA